MEFRKLTYDASWQLNVLSIYLLGILLFLENASCVGPGLYDDVKWMWSAVLRFWIICCLSAQGGRVGLWGRNGPWDWVRNNGVATVKSLREHVERGRLFNGKERRKLGEEPETSVPTLYFDLLLFIFRCNFLFLLHQFYIYIYYLLLTIYVHKVRSECRISYIIHTIATENPKRTVFMMGKFVAKPILPVSSTEGKFWKQKI